MLNSLLSFFKMVKTSKVQKKKDRKSKKCCQWDPERGVLMNWCHDDMKCGCRKLCEKHNSPCDALLQTVCLPLFVINKILRKNSKIQHPPPVCLIWCLKMNAGGCIFLYVSFIHKHSKKQTLAISSSKLTWGLRTPMPLISVPAAFEVVWFCTSFTIWSRTWSLTFNWIQICSARAREAVGGRLSETLGRRSGCSAAWS